MPAKRSSAARLVAMLGMLALSVGALTALPTSPVRAVDDAPIGVFIDRLTPVVPAPDANLRVDGRIVNDSGDVMSDVSVRLRLSSRPITARSQIDAVTGAALRTEDTEPTDVIIDATESDITETLPPRGQATFSIRIPLAELPLPGNGVYAIGVEVLGERSGDSELDDRQGMVRTFLPWFPDPVEPVQLVWLWPLADWPAREANGVFLNDRTPQAVSPGGRLTTLVESASLQPRSVSWIADPALLQAVQDMTDGYQVQRGGSAVVGDRGGAARAWLESLQSALDASRLPATTNPTLRVIPYADVDAVALTRAGMDTDVVRAITQAAPIAATAIGQQVIGGLYWAPFGRLDKETADLLASAGVRTVILSGRALRAQNAYAGANTGRAVINTSFGALQAVLREPRMSALLTEPQASRSQSILVRQTFLAESAVLAGTIPADAPSRAIVVGPDDIRWDPSPAVVNSLLRATLSAPWLQPLSMGEFLESPVNPLRRDRGAYGSKALESELTADYLAEVRSVGRELASFTSVLDNPIGVSDSFASALLRTESSAWRSEPQTGSELLETVRSQLTGQIDQVNVLSDGTVTFSGEIGRVPITIENSLDRAVTVGVELRASPSIRLESAPLSNITVEPGRKVSVDIEARVVGSNALPVRVQLLTPDGLEFGTPARIELASTAYARAAAWVVAIAFVAIVVFVVVGVTRRIAVARRGGDVDE
ncbi:MAG: DUF6049 family protein [Candidatus Nanopelagicales bacterium]